MIRPGGVSAGRLRAGPPVRVGQVLLDEHAFVVDWNLDDQILAGDKNGRLTLRFVSSNDFENFPREIEYPSPSGIIMGWTALPEMPTAPGPNASSHRPSLILPVCKFQSEFLNANGGNLGLHDGL